MYQNHLWHKDTLDYTLIKLWPDLSYAMEWKHGQ
jgi:hypothetical protein